LRGSGLWLRLKLWEINRVLGYWKCNSSIGLLTRNYSLKWARLKNFRSWINSYHGYLSWFNFLCLSNGFNFWRRLDKEVVDVVVVYYVCYVDRLLGSFGLLGNVVFIQSLSHHLCAWWKSSYVVRWSACLRRLDLQTSLDESLSSIWFKIIESTLQRDWVNGSLLNGLLSGDLPGNVLEIFDLSLGLIYHVLIELNICTEVCFRVLL